jgi:signal transduction histidine kinase/Flp pilus assembly protein TadD
MRKTLTAGINIFVLLSWFLFVNTGMAQQNPLADSLLREIQTATEDTAKYNLFQRLSMSYELTNSDYIIEYANEALSIAERLDDKGKIANSINLLGIGYKKKGEFIQSLDYFEQGLELARQNNLEENIPQFLNNIGLIHANRGDLNEAMKYYLEALEIIEEKGDQLAIANLINNIGIIYFEQGNKTEALEYFERSLDIQRDRRDSLGISIALTNVGESLDDMERKTEALEKYEEALAISEQINDRYGVSYLLATMGEIRFNEGNYEVASDDFSRALEIANEIGDVEGKARILGLLGEVLQKQRDLDQSNEYCFEALSIAEKLGAKQTKRDLYETIAENYKLQENFQKAYDYQVLYKAVNDSIFNEEKSRQINELSIQYETREREAEVKLLKEQQAKNEALLQRRTILSWTAALVLLFVSFMAWSLFQRNQRKQTFNKELQEEVEERTSELRQSNLQLEKSNKELEQFAYITSHDLKEPLRNIISFTELIERQIGGKLDEETEDYMHTVKGNARQMHALIEGVLEFARIENIDFRKEVVDLNSITDKIKNVLQASIEESKVDLKIDKLHPVIGNSSQLFLVLKNLIENALKYNNDKTPRIVVSSSVENGMCEVSVEDNGIGIEKDYHDKIFDMFQRLHIRKEYKGAGLGLSICKKIVQNLGGDIRVESELGEGSRFVFTVPFAGKS